MRYLIAFMAVTLLLSCSNNNQEGNGGVDPLPSWESGNTKESIIQFVEKATNELGSDYVPIPDRITVFDNDGNLWSEKPFYFQFYYAMDKLMDQAPDHPEWKTEQPYKAALEQDMETLASFGEHGILDIVMATHSGLTTEEFEASVKDWLSTARHPRFDRPYTDLVYQPMLELLEYLQDHDFKTFIVSGGGLDFMRPWVEQVYNIPRDQVVGSSLRAEFTFIGAEPVIRKLPEIDFIDDKEGKPLGIQRFIGRRPVFCSGNSDGDLAMMQWTAAGDGPRFMLYLHHTDSIREWAYDRKSPVGRLDKGLDEAMENGWTVIDMEKDWKVIYPFDLK